MVTESLSAEHVDVLAVRLPRATREKAVEWLLERVRHGLTTPVCFPDMSTINLACRDAALRHTINDRFHTLNDGAGVEWAARRQGRPLPENLNGTDLCPLLLSRLPTGTRVFLLGATSEVVEHAAAHVAARHPQVQVVGWCNGYFSSHEEPIIVERVVEAAPQVVLVAMGNPRQIQFIDRHQDDPRLHGITWLAVGGLLGYWAGAMRRAPSLVRRLRMEWAWIMLWQPHKWQRYLLGVPTFIARCLLGDLHRRWKGGGGRIPKLTVH